MTRPMIIGRCGHGCCDVCLKRIFQEDRLHRCPTCRSEFSINRSIPNYGMIELIRSLKVTDGPHIALEVQTPGFDAYPVRQLRSGNHVQEANNERPDVSNDMNELSSHHENPLEVNRQERRRISEVADLPSLRRERSRSAERPRMDQPRLYHRTQTRETRSEEDRLIISMNSLLKKKHLSFVKRSDGSISSVRITFIDN